MPEVIEQLRRYGEAVEHLADGPVVPMPGQRPLGRLRWVATGAVAAAVVVLAAVFMIVDGRDLHRVTTASKATSEDTRIRTLTYELSRDNQPMVLALVDDITNACRKADVVKTVVELPKGAFALKTDCRATSYRPTEAIRERLVQRAGRFNNAFAKAEVVARLENALQSELQYEPRADDGDLVWYFSIGNPETCRRARDRNQIRDGMAAVASSETPERWTLIEAVVLAGACPSRLDDLYANVAALGYPDAARAVEDLIDGTLSTERPPLVDLAD